MRSEDEDAAVLKRRENNRLAQQRHRRRVKKRGEFLDKEIEALQRENAMRASEEERLRQLHESLERCNRRMALDWEEFRAAYRSGDGFRLAMAIQAPGFLVYLGSEAVISENETARKRLENGDA
ncbi:hypothetical protein PWT90_09558 [Aphanocladium album]|nr:hypothetical protein PWT90_09558 [Aphanocladium album]